MKRGDGAPYPGEKDGVCIKTRGKAALNLSEANGPFFLDSEERSCRSDERASEFVDLSSKYCWNILWRGWDLIHESLYNLLYLASFISKL